MAPIRTLKQTGVSTLGRAGTSGQPRHSHVLSALLNIVLPNRAVENARTICRRCQEMAPLEAALAAPVASTHPCAVRSPASERPLTATYGNCSPCRIHPSVFLVVMYNTALPAPQLLSRSLIHPKDWTLYLE